jgi:hypothetical protein
MATTTLSIQSTSSDITFQISSPEKTEPLFTYIKSGVTVPQTTQLEIEPLTPTPTPTPTDRSNPLGY